MVLFFFVASPMLTAILTLQERDKMRELLDKTIPALDSRYQWYRHQDVKDGLEWLVALNAIPVR